MKNISYVKHTVGGLLVNPITKDRPVQHPLPNRAMRRMRGGRPFSNKKGVQVVVTRIGTLTFQEIHKRIQLIEAVDYKLIGVPNSEDIHVKQPRKAIAQNIFINNKPSKNETGEVQC